MGKLENRSSAMSHHRLMTRIDTIKNDPRYEFMFRQASLGGDTMAAVLNQAFSLESEDQPLTILKLASLPDEVVDAVVCVLARLAFDFALWSDGAIPILLACEEAHRYASADQLSGFAPARRALKRIAREGRKYGVHLCLVTQRPAELDPTIISQCSTFFVMRMTNDADQALLRSAVSEAAANLLGFVPSLGAQEAIGIGEGLPLVARITFSDPAARGDPPERVGRPRRGRAAAGARRDRPLGDRALAARHHQPEPAARRRRRARRARRAERAHPGAARPERPLAQPAPLTPPGPAPSTDRCPSRAKAA